MIKFRVFGRFSRVLTGIVTLLIIGNFNHIEAYGEKVAGAEKEVMVKEIRQLVRQLKRTGYSQADLGYFPLLKGRTNTSNDSALVSKVQQICRMEISKINSYDELEGIITFLMEVNDAINDIKEFERLIYMNPPVVYLEELIKYWDFTIRRQSGKDASVDVDTVKLLLFYKYDFFISYAKGSKKYNDFIKKVKTDPFMDMLVDMELLRGAEADTIDIIRSVMGKIIDADERVRMLAFGYYGLHIAEKVYAELNWRYVNIKQHLSPTTHQDSAHIELFCSGLFKEFGKIYSAYAQKIDQMKIAIGYGELYNPDFFEEAQHIKEYLKNTAPEKK